VATGTSPIELGQQVSAAVIICKDGLAAGEHGIGDCVSDFVTTHNHGHAKNVAAESSPSRPSTSTDTSEHDRGRSVARETTTTENHGAAVSEAAHEKQSDGDHGRDVSNEARDNEHGRGSEELANPGRGNGPDRSSAAFDQGRGNGRSVNEDAVPGRGNGRTNSQRPK
jgi:hypothetical protein